MISGRFHGRLTITPASWNLGCQLLFEEGAAAVIVANDDILCSRVAVDGLVNCWLQTQAAIVTGEDVSEQMRPEEVLQYTPTPAAA